MREKAQEGGSCSSLSPKLLVSLSHHSHSCKGLSIFYNLCIYYSALTPPDSPLPKRRGIFSTLCSSEHPQANHTPDSFTGHAVIFFFFLTKFWYLVHLRFLHLRHGRLDGSPLEATPSILPGKDVQNQHPSMPSLPKRII